MKTKALMLMALVLLFVTGNSLFDRGTAALERKLALDTLNGGEIELAAQQVEIDSRNSVRSFVIVAELIAVLAFGFNLLREKTEQSR